MVSINTAKAYVYNNHTFRQNMYMEIDQISVLLAAKYFTKIIKN